MKPSTKRRGPDGLIGLFLAAALSASFLVLFAHYHRAQAEPAELAQAAPAGARLSSLGTVDAAGDVGRGSLLFRVAGSDELRLAPLVATEVEFEVGGIIGRAKIRQTFVNPTDQWLEGIYVFPLPENAAVDGLVMRVGERDIVGQIKEREAARARYEAAKEKGKRAALLESERPNVFTSSVANIGPGAAITVSFEYQQKLRYDQGSFRLRFPMVVAPRYHAGEREMASGGGGPVPAGGAPTKPRPGVPVVTEEGVKANPVSVTISLKPGFPISELKSPHHAIDVERLADDDYRIPLKDKVVPADRDFELVWKPEAGAEPTAGLFSEVAKGEHYLMAMVMPPAPAAETKRIAREVVFVIDTSGSMDGASIVQAKKALKLAIQRLDPKDRFNVIRFDSATFALFREPRPATDEAKATAAEAVAALDASGGTRMAPAIELALGGSAPQGFLRQVIFITDGAVDNERQLFGIVDRRLGRSRLFTVGIGSAPNSYFMVKAAEVGRGTYTTIGAVTEVGERMEELFRKLETPMLSDLRAEWPDGVVAETPLASPVSGAGVAKLWARDKIDHLLDGLFEGGDREEVQRQVTALALEHGLVSEFTSLVAVDETPARPGEKTLISREVPINLPQGWNPRRVFGAPGQPAPAGGQAAAGASTMRRALVQGMASASSRPPVAAAPRPTRRAFRQQLTTGRLQALMHSGSAGGAGSRPGMWIEASAIEAASASGDPAANDRLPCGQS